MPTSLRFPPPAGSPLPTRSRVDQHYWEALIWAPAELIGIRAAYDLQTVYSGWFWTPIYKLQAYSVHSDRQRGSTHNVTSKRTLAIYNSTQIP